MRQPHRGLQRLVEHLHAMMLLQRRGDAAHHQDRLFLVRLGDLHDLKAPRKRRVLLDVLLVLGPGRRADRAQRAARERRLEQVRGVARARRAARADQRMRLVDEEDHRLLGALHFLDHLTQPVLELALHAGAGLQQADIERAQRHAAQRRRHVARDDPLRKPFHDRRLADARLARQQRIVLAPPHQDIDHLPNLLVAPDDRIELAVLRLLREIDRVALERFAAAHRGGRERAAGAARVVAGCGAGAKAVARRHARFRRRAEQAGEAIDEIVELDAVELPRDAAQAVAQRRRLQHPDDQMPGAHLRFVEQQRPVDPAALDGLLDLRGNIRDRGRAARQRVERLGEIARETRGIDAEVLDDPVQVGILKLQDLVEPVRQFDVRVAAQLAEHGRTFYRAITQRVEFAEQCYPADLGHVLVPPG